MSTIVSGLRDDHNRAQCFPLFSTGLHDSRKRQGIGGPLVLGIDTHALNDATLAWLERKYNRAEHGELICDESGT